MKKNTLDIKISLVVMIVLVALLGSFVVFLFMDFGMMMNPDGSMGNCPFSPNGSICTMGFREHMSTWQTMFAAVPQKMTTANFILLALWFSFSALIFKNLLLKYSKLLFYDYRLYTKQYSYISLVDPAQRAIYQGLINPKIF